MIPISQLSGIITQSGTPVSGGGGPMPTPPSTGFVTFTLTSSTSATYPFSVGHAFKQGDLPSGSTLTGVQLTIKNTWPDGSAKIATVSGGVALTASTPKTIGCQIGSAPSGANLTTTDLKNTGLTASIDCVSRGTVSWATTDWDTPFSTWIQGPLMSSFVYRKPVGSDTHLVAWLEVRVFLSGEVEVLPWVENGYTMVTGPTSKAGTYTFTLNGAQRFSRTIELRHHMRSPLIDGTKLSHWSASDCDLVVLHNRSYLMSTELVPTYRGTLAAGNGNIGVQPTSFTPLQQGGFRYAWTATNVNTGFDRDDMSTGGYGAPIGILPTHDILALTSHSSDASISYKTVIWNGYGAGRYHTHYRNEETNYPLALSRYPTMVLADGSGMKDAGSSTNSQSTPTPTGGNYVGWDTAHCPSVGYMAYLLTGKWYFMEECQFALIANHYNITDAARAGGLWNGNGFTPAVSGYTGASGICTTGVQLRSSAWHLRSLVQAFAITPSTHPLFTDLKAVVEANCDWFYAVYGTGLSNPFGLVYDPLDYGSIPGSQAGSAWMQDFVTAAWGYALCLRLPISNTSSTKMSTFFEWKAKNIVNKLGDSSGFWYVNGAPYEFANAPTAQPNYFSVMGATGPWYASWKAMYDATYPTIQSWMSTTEGVLASGYFPENPPPSMFHNLQPAIAYAVRHNATGALASYNRMINASNWSLLNAGFSENPVWGLLPAIIPSVAASSLSLSGPSTGMASVPSTNFTVTVDNPPTGTVLVTPSDGGAGGTFTSSTVSITPTVLSATFTYTASSSGVKTITITNNASLSNPTSLTFTASAYSLPSWMSGKAVGEWFAISGTSGAGGAGIDPWGGIAINPATSEIYIAASGGHNDGADNRVVSLSLASSTPSWTLRKASTWNGSEVNVLYYADGTPGARHIYYHIHYMASRNAILLAGCRFGYGGGTPTGPGMDLFDLSTNQWLPRYTLPDISPYTGYGVAQDTSGNIWTTSGVKFNATTNTWSQPGSGSLGRFPSALDSSRNKIFSLQFADGQGYNPEFGVVSNRLDPTTGNSVSITFNSSAAFTQFTNAQPSYAGMDYDSSNDKFMFYHQGEPSTVYVITPNNTTVWDMSLLSTSGVTPTIAASGAGVNKRFIYVPALNGFVLLAKMSSDLYFIRTS